MQDLLLVCSIGGKWQSATLLRAQFYACTCDVRQTLQQSLTFHFHSVLFSRKHNTFHEVEYIKQLV